MATIINTRDKLLQASPTRVSNPSNAAVLLVASTPAFHVDRNGINDPATITFRATMIGLEGPAVFSASGATLTVIGNVATLTYANMAGANATVTATVIENGQVYSTICAVSKVLDGANGGAGANNAIVYAYQRALSTPAGLPGAADYSFASAAITTATLANGWSKTIPAGTNPLFVTAASASATGSTASIAANQWAAATMLAQNGANGANGSNGNNGADGGNGAPGLNSATLYIYQRNATGVAPALPAASATYTFASGALTGLDNGWSTTVPAVAAGQYLFVSRATAVASTATDTVAAGEWAAAQILAQNGRDGAVSLYPALEDGSWSSNVPLASVSDGPAGSTVRRSNAGVDSVFGQTAYFPIDRSRTYQTRFWARASATANGLLYADLQQFLNNTGSVGPVNGGRSPYKPGGVAPANARVWTEYSFTWSAADWQAGVTHVKPDFLLNYSGNTGYWEIQDYKFSDVTESAVALAAAKLAQTDATSALTKITSIGSDSILSPGEKPAVLQEYNVILAEQAGIVARATAFAIGNPLTNYNNVVTDLKNYLNALTGWNTIPGADVTISRTEFSGKFENVYGYRQTLLNTIAEEAGKRATDVTLSATGVLSGGGTSGRITALPTIDLGDGTHFGARNRNDAPSEYPWGSSKQFKTATAIGLSAGASSYCTLETIKQYPDASGGGIYQYAYQDLSTWRRYCANPGAASSAWLAWAQDLDRNSYTGDLNASSDLVLVASSGIKLEGNAATKLSGASWDEQVYSPEGYTGGAFASARVFAGSVMIGLNPDPTENASYNSIDYSIYAENGGTLYKWGQAGNLGVIGTWAAGDIIAVLYDGSNIIWHKNGVALGSLAVAGNQKYHFDSSFAENGSKLTNMRFGPLSSNNWASVGGAGKPADNATVGAQSGVNLKDSGGNVMSDALVRNGYTENGIGHVMRPQGASCAYGPGKVGALEVALPAAMNNSCTMMRFRVEIYEYNTGRSCTYIISGYNYSSPVQWYNVSAEYSGPPAGRKRVRFGNAGARNAVYIGEANSVWDYPQVRVTEVTTGYSNFDWSLWASGWACGIYEGVGTINAEVAEPGVGGAMARIDFISVANAPNFIQADAITDSLIGGNLKSTNWNGNTGLGGTGWLLERATGNFYGNSARLRGAVFGGSYDSYAWPANPANVGYYLGPEGLLLGNANSGRYVQISAAGNFYSSHFNIIDGVGTLGALSIGNGGHVRSGQTDYNNGIGFFLGTSGGVAKFSVGNSAGGRMTYDGVNFTITNATITAPTMDSFTLVSMSNITGTTTSGTRSYGTKTATPQGGVAPFSYNWTKDVESGSITMLNVTTATVTLSGSNYNDYVIGTVTCTCTDANGRSTQRSLLVNKLHGTGIPP